MGAALLSLAWAAMPGSAATFDVSQSLWGDISTPNSLAWAIHQANTTAGADVIRLFNNVSVNQADPIPFTGGFLVELTDPAGLHLQGNGFSLVGNPAFLSAGGTLVTKNNPQRYEPSTDNLFVDALSFAKISDHVSSVSVDGLVVDGLNAFLDVGKGSLASVSNSTIIDAVNFGHNGRAVFNAQQDSTVNLTGVTLRNINPFDNLFPPFDYSWAGAIIGEDATFNINKSTLDLFASSAAGAVNLVGGTANIVSSIVVGRGLSVVDHTKQGVINLVNSVFIPSGPSATARIQAYAGGVVNMIASTLQYDAFFTTGVANSTNCPLFYSCNGSPLQAFNNGEIHLQSSAVSVLHDNFAQIQNPYSDVYFSLSGQPLVGTLSADRYSYVQPVTHQDGATLKHLFHQPDLITLGDAYVLDANSVPLPTFEGLPAGATPNTSGPLMAVIPDADFSNQLLNPIDQSVIDTDVFGNPRTTNGRRDVGAVQTPGPLPVLGCGAAFGWSRRLRRRLRQTGALR